MQRPVTTKLRIGAWCVDPSSGQISRDGETARVEVRAMRVLLCLAEHVGEVVSIDDLLNQVWADVTVAPDSVYQAVTSLRRLLGDDPKQPAYIETVPRLGYRMVAPVRPWTDSILAHAGSRTTFQTGSSLALASENSAPATPDAHELLNRSGKRFRAAWLWGAGALLCLAFVVAFVLYRAFPFRAKIAANSQSAPFAVAAQPQMSIAVLPFLDLTDEMNQEPFADGMTEELIDKLSKIPGLRVPPPTSSFYFKSKLWPRSHGAPQITIAEIARALDVSYLLDGSVRRAGARVRVDTRLVRADRGFVVWSESYDRPFDDLLMVQDDIAGQVAKALQASIRAP